MKKRLVTLAAIVVMALILCGNAVAATQTCIDHQTTTLHSGTIVNLDTSIYYYVGELETTLPFFRHYGDTEPENTAKHSISVVVLPEGEQFFASTVTSDQTNGRWFGNMYKLQYKDGIGSEFGKEHFISYYVAMDGTPSNGKSFSFSPNHNGAFYIDVRYFPDPNGDEWAVIHGDFLVLSQQDVNTYLSTGEIYGYTWPGLKDLLTSTSATPTVSKVTVNGTQADLNAYNINGNNYFKLRDIAKVISGSGKQFDVTWDADKNAINLISGKAYTVVGGELATQTETGVQTAKPTASAIYKDGNSILLTPYNINGNNYFKLRDLGETFNFGVAWDGATNTIAIDTSTVYTPDK